MEYFYNPGTSREHPTFLLLHGTGGRETDLLPVAQRLDVRNGVLAVRGNVNENGKLRYFKRFEDGSLDEADLMAKTDDLKAFLDEASTKHEFDRNNVIALGYSNGANIAAHLMFQHKKTLRGAVLFHSMVPRINAVLPDLSGTNIFISAGAVDSIVLPGESMQLKKILEEAGAETTMHLTDYGHALAESEIEAAVTWYVDQFVTF